VCRLVTELGDTGSVTVTRQMKLQPCRLQAGIQDCYWLTVGRVFFPRMPSFPAINTSFVLLHVLSYFSFTRYPIISSALRLSISTSRSSIPPLSNCCFPSIPSVYSTFPLSPPPSDRLRCDSRIHVLLRRVVLPEGEPVSARCLQLSTTLPS
jgi:hypothetical protein